jgi:hypothetical protein
MSVLSEIFGISAGNNPGEFPSVVLKAARIMLILVGLDRLRG